LGQPWFGSPELLARAEELGLVTVEACSIVAASDGPETCPSIPELTPKQLVDTRRPYE
jgi:hypothetical protein